MMIMKMTCLETQTDRQTDRQGKQLMVLGVEGKRRRREKKGGGGGMYGQS